MAPDGSTPRRRLTALVLLEGAISLRAAGQQEAALKNAEASLLAARREGSQDIYARALTTKGNLLTDLGSFDRADAALQEAAESFRGSSEWTAYAQVMVSRGRLLAERGNTEASLEFFTDLHRMSLPVELRSQILNNLGLLNERLGNLSEAIEFLLEDVRLCSRLGDPAGEATARLNLVGPLKAANRDKAAKAQAAKATTLFALVGNEQLAKKAAALT